VKFLTARNIFQLELLREEKWLLLHFLPALFSCPPTSIAKLTSQRERGAGRQKKVTVKPLE
jgi:hypothetical protein